MIDKYLFCAIIQAVQKQVGFERKPGEPDKKPDRKMKYKESVFVAGLALCMATVAITHLVFPNAGPILSVTITLGLGTAFSAGLRAICQAIRGE